MPDGVAAVLHVAQHQVLANVVEHFRKTRTDVIELTLQGARAQVHLFGHALDAGLLERHQQVDVLAHFLQQRALPHHAHRHGHAFRITHQFRIGRRVGRIHVDGPQHHSVELAVENHRAGKILLVLVLLTRRGMHETHLLGRPTRTQHRLTGSQHDARDQLGCLHVRNLGIDQHFKPQDAQIAGLVQGDRGRIVEQFAVLNGRQPHIAQARLVAHENAQNAEIQRLAMLGHLQTKGRAVRLLRRQIEELAKRLGGNVALGIHQRAGIEPHLLEQAVRIHAVQIADAQKAVQRDGSDQCIHSVASHRKSVDSFSRQRVDCAQGLYRLS